MSCGLACFTSPPQPFEERRRFARLWGEVARQRPKGEVGRVRGMGMSPGLLWAVRFDGDAEPSGLRHAVPMRIEEVPIIFST